MENFYYAKRTESAFSQGLTRRPCPKKSGRANGLGDIGKYVNRPFTPIKITVKRNPCKIFGNAFYND